MAYFRGNLICASLFTGNYDVNRSEMLQGDNFQLIEKWCRSIQSLDLKGVVFHNSFSEETIRANQLTGIEFVAVDFNTPLSANAYRYLVYVDFLKKYQNQLENVFFTDIADVEVVKNPFDVPFYDENSDSIFCGDEEEILDNPWMNEHSNHLRNLIPEFKDFEEKNKNQPLLNCGIIGGKIELMVQLMQELSRIHSTYTVTNKTPYTLDMGAFNFVMRTQFADQIIHGFPVNTRFKCYESTREDCWFRHK
ncbi:hypothetical protein [Algoriphagus hitonicola]|uniref:Uncharacterized protein n=1 Tax=Algoriphagus hitonicola TaxID=435880 RepID=A0A1I2PC24_9BACT|nr:hypothetical protein [Algoriphagus hitonicola]SFG11216.1 hypothetical protein SAMN04487988_101449 [Algoriphagus hitonicola]